MNARLGIALAAAIAWMPLVAQAGLTVPPPEGTVPLPGVLGLLAAGGVAAIVVIRNRRK
jgi:hypothetical protein